MVIVKLFEYFEVFGSRIISIFSKTIDSQTIHG